VREKYCSFTEKVQMISQANRAGAGDSVNMHGYKPISYLIILSNIFPMIIAHLAYLISKFGYQKLRKPLIKGCHE